MVELSSRGALALAQAPAPLSRARGPWHSYCYVLPIHHPGDSAMLRRRFLTVMAGASAAIAGPSVLRAQSATIKLATSAAPPSIHNIYLHVAYERGFFRQNGIAVSEFIQLRGGPLANQAIAAGQIDVTASDAEGLRSAAAKGYAMRRGTGPGAEVSYIVSVRKEISSVADLKGKPFAVSPAGAPAPDH